MDVNASFAVNRANWDERAPAHAASPDYRVAAFSDDPAALSQVARFDVRRPGDVRGLRGVPADVALVESDVYGAPDVLPARAFDLVSTGIGALCLLPSVRRWAEVVAGLLAPGGRLFLREGSSTAGTTVSARS